MFRLRGDHMTPLGLVEPGHALQGTTSRLGPHFLQFIFTGFDVASQFVFLFYYST